jgi:predicted acyl esterase
MVYRTEPFAEPIELTGPIQLDLRLASDATDADVFVVLFDEAPDGTSKLLTRGWLRASHRAVDPGKSRVNQPWHPHTSLDPLEPGVPVDLNIEIIPNSNVYGAQHRLRLEIAGSDSMPENSEMYHRGHLHRCTNTIFHGEGSVLHVPVIPA